MVQIIGFPAVGLLLTTMCSCQTTQKPTGHTASQAAVENLNADLRKRAMRTIADRDASLKEIRDAIAHLGPPSEGRKFWTDIANDASYSDAHRRICILAFFSRHGLDCDGVRKLGMVLQKPTWLKDSHIETVSAPDEWVLPAEGSQVFRIAVLPDYSNPFAAVYIGVVEIDGKMDRSTFSHILRGTPAYLLRTQDALIGNMAVYDTIVEDSR